MRVALVNPNRMRPAVAPIGLEYLAEELESHGHEPIPVDLCFEPDPAIALARRLAATQVDLVAITVRNADDCYMATQRSFIREVRDLVETGGQACGAPVVLGGAGFSIMPEALLSRTGAAYGIVGDGEAALVALARMLERGEDPSGIPGLVAQDGDGWQINPPAWPDLQGSNALRWTHFDVERYFREGGQIGLETKRGCTGACTYCADRLSKGTRVRARPVASVVEEAASLVARGIDRFHLCDAEVNLPPDHLTGLCDAFVASGLGERMRWWGYATPHGVDGRLCDLMRRAGCAGINFGIDHGDEAMLRRLGRDYGVADIERAVSSCKRAGIAVMCDLLLGGPGESMRSIRTTIELMERLDPLCVGVSFGIRLCPGTRLAQEVLGQGPLGTNPNLRGAVEGNDDLAMPVYFVDAALGPEPEQEISDLVGDDPRFFFGGKVEEEADYNYSDNQPLVDAIARGARGAYWQILAEMRRA